MYNLNEIVRIIHNCNTYQELSKCAKILESIKYTFALVDLQAITILFKTAFKTIKK